MTQQAASVGETDNCLNNDHGIRWPPITVPSSALSVPVRWIKPSPPSATLVHQKRFTPNGYQVGVFLETRVCLLLSDQLLVLCYICLRLLSYSVDFFFFRALWVSTLMACWSAFQAAMALWGELINWMKEWWAKAMVTAWETSWTIREAGPKQSPALWYKWQLAGGLQVMESAKASVKRSCDVVNGNLKVWGGCRESEIGGY